MRLVVAFDESAIRKKIESNRMEAVRLRAEADAMNKMATKLMSENADLWIMMGTSQNVAMTEDEAWQASDNDWRKASS